MTKKILALALAGTTAFSVFAGAMSVNAAAIKDKASYAGYTFVALEPSATSLKVTGLSAIGSGAETDINVTVTAADEAATADKFAAAVKKYEDGLSVFLSALDYSGDTKKTVEDGKVYIYDYTGATKDNLAALKAKAEAYAAAVKAAKDYHTAHKEDADWAADKVVSTSVTIQKLLENIETAEAAVFAAIDTATDDFDDSTSRANEARYKAINTYATDVVANLLPASDYDFDETGVEGKYKTLYNVLVEYDEAANYEALPTSVLVYLTQQYKGFDLGEVDTADVTDVNELIDVYTDILDARSASDYAKASAFRTFQNQYEELCEEYSEKTALSALEDYRDELAALISADTGENAADTDISNLKDALEAAKGYTAANYEDNDRWRYFDKIKGVATAVSKSAEPYQSSADALADLLNEAIGELAPDSAASDWAWARLQNAIDAAEELNEEDYTAATWKTLKTKLAAAQRVLDANNANKEMLSNVSRALEEAIDAMKAKKPTSTLKREFKEAVVDAKAKLAELSGNNTNSAQVLALTKAISTAEGMWKDTRYTDVKDGTLISAINNSIAELEAAMTFVAQPIDWYVDDEGNDHYGTADGDYNDGWHKIDGLWFFFNDKGVALKNQWVEADGKWSWVGSNCVCYRSSWIFSGGHYYYVDQNGYMLDGEWLGWNGNWYWLDKGGRMATGWRTIGNKQYYFGTDGAMLSNTVTPDGYEVGVDGAYIQK